MNKPAQFSFDVFLSHNSKDKARVRALAERLKKAGLRVWFDEWVIKAGDDIYLSIERGLESARTLVLCMSPAAFGSDWVGLERSTVLFRNPSNSGRRFIPLLLVDCTPPDTLRRYKYVDFRQDNEATFHELLTACRPETEETAAAEPPRPEKTTETKKQPKQTEPLAEFERKLTGHKTWVTSVAVTPDGKWAVSGSPDNTVKIWDLETGNCRATLVGHINNVNCVAITPNGKRILSGSEDKTIRIWDCHSGESLASWQAHTSPVLSLAPLADGHRVISTNAGGDPTLKLWDIDALECSAIFKGHDGAVTSVAVADGVVRAVSGSRDKTIRVWNLATGECLTILKGHAIM